MEGGRQPWTENQLLFIALFLRVFLVFYARIHDYFFDLNFTDVDYQVFSDAAFLVSQAKSPYERATYRYTPLIAWLLVPNRLLPDFGKFLFSAIDVLVGWLQLRILNSNKTEGSIRKHHPVGQSIHFLWLFNPFNAIIATRGNSDSLICLLVLLTLFNLQSGGANRQSLFLSALVHGAGATHFRIYPLIYIPSIFLHLSSYGRHEWQGIKIFILRDCLANKRGFCFIFLSLSSFTLFTGFFCLLYGSTFLDSSLLYHLTRVDTRHNFSPYFLPLYLTMNRPEIARFVGIAAFLPQLFCILLFAFRYSHDLPFCWFLTTFSFVSLNKVSTSQYFIWYLCFLPFVHSRVKMDSREKLRIFLLWLFAQAHWLIAAFLLEFHGINTFAWIWMASLLFLAINMYIMSRLAQAYSSPFHNLAVEKKKE